MKRVYVYMVVAIACAAVASCEINDESYRKPEIAPMAVVVCETTVRVLGDYTAFAEMGFVFNEYLNTADEYKPLIRDTYLSNWIITMPSEDSWQISAGSEKYRIYPGGKPLDEVGSLWRIVRVKSSGWAVGGEQLFEEECFVSCEAEDRYSVKIDEITSALNNSERYAGSADIVITTLPRGDNIFQLRYNFEASGEYLASRVIASSGVKEEIQVLYTFEGRHMPVSGSYRTRLSYAEAEIESGKIGASALAKDNITMKFSRVESSSIYTMTLVHNGRHISHSGHLL